MNKGFIDAPASEDKFEIKNYIDGISKFILTCNTPMTMSIQGDWGTGKTSIMELAKILLKNLFKIRLKKCKSCNSSR